MSIQEKIIQSIDLIVERSLEKYRQQDVSSVVTEIKNGKYKVLINGADYYVKDGVCVNPNVGTSVWIHMPNGNIKDAYISALK